MPRRKLAFGWYGGKFSHLKWLLPLLPRCLHYVEPYGGSAAVLLNRQPSPLETYNDLDGEVINFFRVLRAQKGELIEAISLTPFSRAEYLESIQSSEGCSDLERAKRFYVRTRQSFFGLSQSGSPGRWAYCKTDSRRGMSGSVSRYLGGIENLAWVAGRLKTVQIECSSAREVLERYDGPGTLFYLDPPYPHESRCDKGAFGSFEMSSDEHAELAEVLHGLEGKVAISGYRCPMMDGLYAGWRCFEASARRCNSSWKGGVRREALWMNYPREALSEAWA